MLLTTDGMRDEERQKGTYNDVHFQRFTFSVCMCISYFICGWIRALTSTALFDLQKITNVTLDESSLYMTFLSFGFVVGSFIYGSVNTHVDKFIIQFLALTLAAVSLVTISFCNLHVAMVTMHAVVGFCIGIIDSATNAEMLAVWGKSGRSFMQAMYFSDSIGGVIAPVVTAQFLSPWQQAEQSAFNHTTVDHRNNNHSEGANVYGENRNFSNQGVTVFSSRILAKDNETISTQYYIISPLFYAYMIPAIICLLVALIYMIMFLSFKCNIYADRDIAEVTSSGYISTSRKVMILINIGLMSGVYTAIEESFSGFLSTFCITQFKWTTANSSYILCAFYSCMGMGRLVAVFWVSYLNPKKILGVLCLLVSVMLLSTTLCSLQSSDSGLWLSVALLGFVFAVILPTVFTWTEEDYFPVTGHISSYLNIAADCGATVNPVIIGSMMEHYSPMWFTYILLIESFVLLTTYVIGAFLSRQNRKAINGNTYQSME